MNDIPAPAPADAADPLAFDPVPRRIERVDGWTAERQRAFIRALSLCGSKRRAAGAVGKAAWGVDQLLKAKGAESFSAAYDRALALYHAKEGGRLEAGIETVAAEDAAWAPARGPWQGAASRAGAGPAVAGPAAARPAPPPSGRWQDSEDLDPEKLADFVYRNYVTKVWQEAEARAAGRIATADFYLRQITQIELVLEAVAEGRGLIPILTDLRLKGRPVLSVAATDATRLIDEMRHAAWSAADAASRPEPIGEEWLVDKDGVYIEPTEATRSDAPSSHEEQREVFRERYEAAAQAQVEWEAEARRDFERRSEAEPRGQSADRAANDDLGEDEANAGQRGPTGGRTDVTGFTPVMSTRQRAAPTAMRRSSRPLTISAMRSAPSPPQTSPTK